MIKEAFNELLMTDDVTPKTREVLLDREQEIFGGPFFFAAEDFDLLQQICDHLLAQNPEERIVNIAGNIDQRLAKGTGIGWRYDKLPPDGEAYQKGLQGIRESVLLLPGKNFDVLSSEQKTTFLKQLQQDQLAAEIWKKLSAKLFFELMLTEATDIFYSHPGAQAEINYTGFADAKGWNVPQLTAEL